MYLKKIIASGFKSFADKITLDLTNGITGVVGPNGSGKSNIVDAVRWVLGEQSVKSLRGDGNMTDVIFSGSKSRKPLNVASVTLIFDNQDKYLPIDYEEVAIKRRVYRDGTNEYFINNEKCRLKDVTDLLLDTGIAKESFNIISQGKVDEIISSKPSERRVIFEEAARVLKYKKRKEEALRKLDKTHDNMNRVNDIIKELETQVEPLKEQKEKALIYGQKSKELEEVEVSLITSEITNINYEYQLSKAKIEELSAELLKSETNHNSSEAKIETFKNTLSVIEDEITKAQNKLLEKTKEVEKLNGQKNILLERKKYSVENSKLQESLVASQEKQLKIKLEINKLKIEADTEREQLKQLENEITKYESEIQTVSEERNNLEKKLRNQLIQKNELENKIDHLKESIENNSFLPVAVKSVLNHPKLRGIRSTIGQVIEVEEKYTTAITTVLGFAANNIIVDNEENAKEAIQYLKQNNLGRATFFPLNIIQSKKIDSSRLKTMEGFIDIASNLVQCDSLYKNIIENQLGNVLVVDNIDHANQINKLIHQSYRIVTLDGSLFHVGGSITGGTIQKSKNIVTEKYELENSLKKFDQKINEIKDIENKMNEIDYNRKSIEDKLYISNRNKINKQELIRQKEQYLEEQEKELEELENQITGTNGMLNNNLIEEETAILNQYYEALKQKDELEQILIRLKNKKMNINDDLEEYELNLKKENSLYNQKNKDLNNLEIEVNRMDVKLDTLLNKLNETYSMTYEKAVTTYKLEMDIEVARNQVSNLKREIKELGNVNLDSIEEYEKVSTRFEFLSSQREDLSKAEDTLLEIIQEMDEVMIQEFSKSFEDINQKFKETFQELFKGGHAELKLTDPDNLLETGIEIVASPPGKSLKSISLLSGGEKTFTAISLLFAILKCREMPFCILDEVEAALDEANVDGFGEYITKLKEKTQFILITHKKRTMEYADTLYGITMQESGVSKLVSVRLEDF